HDAADGPLPQLLRTLSAHVFLFTPSKQMGGQGDGPPGRAAGSATAFPVSLPAARFPFLAALDTAKPLGHNEKGQSAALFTGPFLNGKESTRTCPDLPWRSRISMSASRVVKLLKACRLPSRAGKCTRSWGPTAPARARWPTR